METQPAVEVAADDSLESFMAKVRQAVEAARPVRVPTATIEGSDPRLAAALLAVHAETSTESLRAVAREYRRLHVMDRAFEFLNQALAIDHQDAATYDELARTWRDSGFADVALGDAYRAVYFAPDSPVVRNTLGTILQSLGMRSEARAQYELALGFEPTAAYALNNLCYGWILEGEAARAETACQKALQTAPGLSAARNNLGIVYAAANQLDKARTEFGEVGDRASALYNIGIVHMARREYAQASTAFVAALQARPTFREAGVRARQSLELLGAGGE